MEYLLFFIIIFLTNIIQGITGFAGTILAMPPSLMLVGYNVAKPVLNVLGILSGVYVLTTNGRQVDKKELKKVVFVMAIGMAGGFLIKSLFAGKEEILYKCLGIFVMGLAVQGLYSLWKVKQNAGGEEVRSVKTETGEMSQTETGKAPQTAAGTGSVRGYALLVSSGVVHGMFVCGGPLLIGYLSKVIKDKVAFRATISTVWIILNSVILIDDVRAGLWNPGLIRTQLITVPFLIAGMVVGTKLYKRMSQQLFMKLTYVLLFISGISLIVK